MEAAVSNAAEWIPRALKEGEYNTSLFNASDTLGKLSPEDKKKYPWDDRGMCRLFADINQGSLRYNSTAKEWFRWDGKRWVKDEGGMFAQNQAKKLANDLVVHSTFIEDEENRSSFLRYVSRYGKYQNRKTLIDDARSEAVITKTDLDGYDNYFNCQNGVYDLTNYRLIPHDPELLLSKLSNVWYDPEAKSELWERFITEIMDDEWDKIHYLQKLMGVALTTDTSLERMVIFYGPTTRNGKSTLLEVVSYMMGGADGYALSVPPETLAKQKRDSRAASGDIARLDGCRLAVASEPPKRMLFDAALIKTMLGRDTITARNLFEREFQFVPRFTLIMNTNYLPYVQDETLFTSKRIDVLPFNRHFKPEEQDTRLKDKLKTKACISAVFNWCLDGLKYYREEGLIPPPSVRDSTTEYKESSDKIGLFLSECMKKTGKNSKGGDVYTCFSNWCRANGFEGGSKRSFFDDMKARGLLAKSGMVSGITLHNVIVGYEIDDGYDDYSADDEAPWP